MPKNKRVADMAEEVLTRQAKAHIERTGEPFEEALKGVLETEAGRQLGELREGHHRHDGARKWQESLLRERLEERLRHCGPYPPKYRTFARPPQ